MINTMVPDGKVKKTSVLKVKNPYIIKNRDVSMVVRPTSRFGLSDRSDTTCQISGLFVEIDSMSFRGSAGDRYSSFWILTGHWTSSKM
jgi:hypothetical protein